MSLLNNGEIHKGDMVKDANTYYEENVNGNFADSSKEKIDESRAVKVGSYFLFAEEEKQKKVIVEMEKVVVKGMEYKAKVFNSKEEANEYLEKNKEWGVIKTEKGKVYVAKKEDKGKKIDESAKLSENVKNANHWF